jgi:hypothetical protein
LTTKLGDLDLSIRKGDNSKGTISEIRSIKSLNVQNKRIIGEQKTPSAYGSSIQDMGRNAAQIIVEGEFVGEGAKQGIADLRKKYKEGKPFEFVSDLGGLAGTNKVLVEELQIENVHGSLNHFKYSLNLREYIPPVQEEEEEKQSNQDDKAKEEVEKQGEIDDIRGQVLDSEGNPAQGIKVKVKGPDGERELTTDENGYYEVLDAAEGTYEITFEGEEFADMKREVEIKKGEGESSGSGQSGEE